ncbi:hypothetical protein BLNAU_10912 [Blattamonas nauphoetae]|uniref:Uncharacterized protein n=1 Tax=Blattamonas nauphoetae TaxID=2049346 RepID=A0ABQ9XR65_9EUKA|nr:hypothetical protein BLNAU_10912 [Blattamonas nauphoetae]
MTTFTTTVTATIKAATKSSLYKNVTRTKVVLQLVKNGQQTILQVKSTTSSRDLLRSITVQSFTVTSETFTFQSPEGTVEMRLHSPTQDQMTQIRKALEISLFQQPPPSVPFSSAPIQPMGSINPQTPLPPYLQSSTSTPLASSQPYAPTSRPPPPPYRGPPTQNQLAHSAPNQVTFQAQPAVIQKFDALSLTSLPPNVQLVVPKAHLSTNLESLENNKKTLSDLLQNFTDLSRSQTLETTFKARPQFKPSLSQSGNRFPPPRKQPPPQKNLGVSYAAQPAAQPAVQQVSYPVGSPSYPQQYPPQQIQPQYPNQPYQQTPGYPPYADGAPSYQAQPGAYPPGGYQQPPYR